MPIDPHLEREARTDRDARRELVRQLRRAGDPRGELLEATLTRGRWIRLLEAWRALVVHVETLPSETQIELVAWLQPFVRHLPPRRRRLWRHDWHGPRGALERAELSAAAASLIRRHDTNAHEMPPFPGFRDRRHDFTQQPGLDLRELHVQGISSRRRGEQPHGAEFPTWQALASARLERILNADCTTNLQRLWLPSFDLDTDSTIALADAAWFGQLRLLDLSKSRPGTRGVAGLAEQGSALQVLHLADTELGPDGLDALLAGLEDSQLRTLDLARNQLDDAAITRLANEPELARLTSLDLSSNPLTDAGLGALLASPWLTGLRRLRLTDTRVRWPGLLELLSGGKRALEWIDLSHTPLGDGAPATSVSSEASRLRTLRLRDCGVTSAQVVALAAHPALATVRQLELGHNRFGTDAAVALARSACLRRLRTLGVGGRHDASRGELIGARGVLAIGESDTLVALRNLDLRRTGLTLDMAHAFLMASGLPALRAIRVGGNDPSITCRSMTSERPDGARYLSVDTT